MIDGVTIGLTVIPCLIGVIASILCALPGSFLLLQRRALLSDAISHVVLLGIVCAFLWSGSLSPFSMLAGAAFSALMAVGLIGAIQRISGTEPSAAMGVVFTSFFALAVLILEQSGASQLHLDAEHALMGNLEELVWLAPLSTPTSALWHQDSLQTLPVELVFLSASLLIMVLAIWALWRGLVCLSFDPEFFQTSGLASTRTSIALILLASLAAVAAFDAVGSILVIAMFICPPSAARLMARTMRAQLGWSISFAALSAISGFWAASALPAWLGSAHSVSAAGMIAVCSGVILALAALFGPERRPIQS